MPDARSGSKRRLAHRAAERPANPPSAPGGTVDANAGGAGGNGGEASAGTAGGGGLGGASSAGGSGGGLSSGGRGDTDVGGSGGVGGQSTDPNSPGCGTPITRPDRNVQQAMEIGGTPRYYLLDVPANADNQTPLMLIFGLHGFDMNNVAV